MPALPTHLVRVASTCKYRSRIPQDLLRFYHSKREVTESPRTKSLTDARRWLPAIQLKYQVEWTNLRAAISGKLTELVITDASIAYLTALFEHDSLSGDEATRLAQNYTIEEIPEYRERSAESNAWLRDAVSIADIERIRPALDQYLGLKRINVTGSEADYKHLALAYLHGAIKTNSALIARMTCEAVPTPKEPRLGGGGDTSAGRVGNAHCRAFIDFYRYQPAQPLSTTDGTFGRQKLWARLHRFSASGDS